MASDYNRSEILDIIERQAERSGIPREDFLRFAYIETGGRFDPDAHNTRSDAKGLFQFLPNTAAEFNIAGREFDPVANTEAAAALYQRNMTQIVRRSGETGHAFLSGETGPNGMDMYLAHQQGGGGYASIQSAIATGEFSRADTRRNILGNIARLDFERVTGQPYSGLSDMNDRDLATSFTRYWTEKYAAIEIADRGIQATDLARNGPLADGVLEIGERGQAVRELQESLNQLQFRDARGAELETRSGIYGQRTAEALRAFQTANEIEATGVADQRTRDAIVAQLRLPEEERNRPPQRQEGDGNTFWPAPGNHALNERDKPGEGNPNQGWTRRDERGNPKFHGGVDIQGTEGNPIVAYASGTVVTRPNNGNAGNTVQITHDDGTVTKYFHLDRITVRDGRIDAGQQIGTMGRSGNVPRQGDTHLHFEMWRDGRQVDPMPYLRQANPEPPRQPAAQEQGQERGFVERMLTAVNNNDDRAMRTTLEEYTRTRGVQGWTPEGTPERRLVDEQQVGQRPREPEQDR